MGKVPDVFIAINGISIELSAGKQRFKSKQGGYLNRKWYERY